MAYDPNNPPSKFTGTLPGENAQDFWVLKHTDDAAELLQTGYITNASSLSMKAGDPLFYTNTNTNVPSWYYVESITNGAATLELYYDSSSGEITVLDYGAVGDGVADDTQAFIDACASGKKVIIPAGEYNITGTFTMAQNTILEGVGNPTINLVMDAGNDEDRGFWFFGVSNAWITGSMTIYAHNLVSNGDGSMGVVFNFGKYCYGSGVDAVKTEYCGVVGDITVIGNQTGYGNLKTVGIYGWSEHIYITGVKQQGDNNFCFVAHWGQNISLTERNAGTLPTKTWHPDNLVFQDCIAESDWTNSNGFTTSACGKVDFIRCQDKGTPEGWNFFVGDLGYSYQQNLDKYPYPRYHVLNCEVNNPVNYGVSIDMQSNPVGLFEGSPLWTSADKDKGGWIIFENFDIYLAQADSKINGLAATGINKLILKNVNIIEQDNTNNTRVMQFYGCNYVSIEQCTLKSMQGILARNCNDVIIDGTNIERFERDPDATDGTNYAITFGAKLTGDPEDPETVSSDSTVDGAVSVGDTEITLDDAEIVIGAGGYIVYGGERVRTLSSTFSGIGTQTIKTEPFHFTVPDGATVTLTYTVINAVVNRCNLNGWYKTIRSSGDEGAEIEKLTISQNIVTYGGIYDFQIDNARNVLISDNVFDHCGQATNTDRRSVLLGENVENFKVMNNTFIDTEGNIRYHVFIDDNANDGTVSGNIFKNLNTGASSPACIYRDASNVFITGDNYFEAGLTKIYPTLHKSFTPVFYGSTTAGSPTGTFTATYQKIDRIVYISVRFQFSNLSTMAGNLMMSGLPFTVSDNVNRRGGIAYGVISGKTTATDVLGGYFVQGTTTLQFTKLNANNTNWAITDTTSSMQCQFSGWYYTDE